MKDHNNLKEITRSLLKEIGEDPNRDGLLKTPERVAKAWDFFSQGYDTDIQSIVNDAIFEEDCSEMVVVRDNRILQHVRASFDSLLWTLSCRISAK